MKLQSAARETGEVFRRRFETIILPVFLFIFALAIRLPYLFELPDFIEENEFIDTLALLHGKAFPLINRHSHIGAIANYLYASSFWIFGRHYWVPRTVEVLLASLTIPLLYFLAKRLIGTKGAIVSAWLLAGSLFHIYFISHVPWSNCLTPFLVTSFVLCFVKAIQDSSQIYFVLSGFLFGLSLQSHPTALIIFPAIVLLFFVQKKESILQWFHKPGFYAAIVASLLAYSNVIYFHLTNNRDTLGKELERHTYALNGSSGSSSYLASTVDAWMLLFRLSAGAIESRGNYWTSPWFVFAASILVAGLILCAIEKRYFVLSLILAPMLLFPAIVHNFDFCSLGRYFGFLIPFACLITGYALLRVLDSLRKISPHHARIRAAVWLLLPLSYLAVHMMQLSRAYAVFKSTNSEKYLSAVRETLQDFPRKESVVLIDSMLYRGEILGLYLDSDGWEVHKMNERMTHRRHVRKTDLHIPEIRHAIKNLRQNHKDVFAIVAPGLEHQFVEKFRDLKLESCFAKSDGSDVFVYVFKVDPDSRSADLKDIERFCKPLPAVPVVDYRICRY